MSNVIVTNSQYAAFVALVGRDEYPEHAVAHLVTLGVDADMLEGCLARWDHLHTKAVEEEPDRAPSAQQERDWNEQYDGTSFGT